MRRVFLWAARNRWLKERLPRMRFMKRAVRRFMPGETLDDALTAAVPLERAGITTMYTRLGENLESLDEAEAVVDHYLEVLDRIKASGHARRDLRQAHPARPRPRRRCLPRPPRHPGEPRGRDRLVPLDRHGRQRLHRVDDRPVRAAPGGRATDRHLPAGVPAPDRRRHRAAPAARPGDPPRQGRLRRARSRSPTATRAASIRASPAWPSTSSSRARAGRSSLASARTTWGSSNRSPTRSPSPASAATATRSRCCTASARTSRSGSRRPATRSGRSSPTASTGIRGTCAASPSDPANVWFALRQILP